MDIFRTPDLEEQQEALNEAMNDYRDRKVDEQEAQEEQDKKDEDFNSKLQAITDPIAQELLRKPVEDLGRKAVGKVVGAVRSRIAGGLRTAGRQIGSRLQGTAERLGVNAEDLDALRSGDVGRIGARLTARVPTQGSATSALPSGDVDEGTRDVLNISRQVRGQLPRPPQPTDTAGEPVEVDAFTGRPIVRQEEAPAPQPIDEADDWTSQLYDSPITHDNDMPLRLPSTRPPTSLATEPENPTARVVANRLNSIFRNTDTSDLPTPSFRPAPRPPPAEASAGDTPVLDQLAPMREAMNIDGPTALRNRSILEQYRNSDGDLLEGRTPLQEAQDEAVSGGATPSSNVGTLQGQGNPVDVDAQPGQTAPAPPRTQPDESPPSGGSGNDSSVDASVSRPAEQETEQVVRREAGSVARTGTEAGLEEGADLALDADPLTAPLGLLLGLGTLLGGVFGGQHNKAPPTADAQPIVNAGVQQGVY